MQHVTAAVVHPWMCDIMGHLNTRFYVGMFDDAHHILIRDLETRATEESSLLGWVDARNEIEYLSEVKAGAVVHLRSHIKRIGTKSLTVLTEMCAASKPFIHSRMSAVLVRFNLAERVTVPLSEPMRLATAAWVETQTQR